MRKYHEESAKVTASSIQLDLLTHEERIPPKVVKSSLKGSRSQLSLEEVAIAARRNAARRHSRSKADAVLKSLLHSAEKARKVGVSPTVVRLTYLSIAATFNTQQ